MSYVRKDTLTHTGEWAAHLRPQGKRLQSRLERRAANRMITEEIEEMEATRMYCIAEYCEVKGPDGECKRSVVCTEMGCWDDFDIANAEVERLNEPGDDRYYVAALTVN